MKDVGIMISAEKNELDASVDTKTPKNYWLAINLTILIATLLMIGLASLIFEHELARLRNPEASFIATPQWFDLTIASTIMILGFANLSVLLFVLLRHLWIRKWMIATTVVGWVLLAIVALVLGPRFLPVIFP